MQNVWSQTKFRPRLHAELLSFTKYARGNATEHAASASETASRRDHEHASAAREHYRGGQEVLMPDLLLTHGYFVYEDPKELQIMKLYAPLGILYLCSHLREKGFDVDVFDTTFSSREALFLHLRSEKPSVLGIYANLMTRKNVVEILKVAREAGWKTIVGGPEPGAYALEYLQAGADFVVFGEGELTVEELLEAFRAEVDSYSTITGIAYLDSEGTMQET